MSPGTARKSILVLVVATVLLTVGAFAWLKLAPRRVPEGQPPLTTLGSGSVPAFRDAFNAAHGDVRVLAMLSPT